jgi:peroxiredoxin Q/BCP
MADHAPPAFELRNAGIGPDPLSLGTVADLVDFAILLLLRDYHCPKCRAQVQRVAEKAGTVQRRDTAVIPVLPDSYEKARSWQEEYDLPFPLLADPDGDVGEQYDQGRRFGALGQLHDVIGRMPKAVVLDLQGTPEIVEAYEGSSPGDRPQIEELLDTVDDIREEFVFDCELVEC